VSLIKKADVKNHLSARHRHEIHLYRPEDDPRTATFVEGADAKLDESVESPVKPFTPSGPEAVPSVAPSDSTQSKSVQP